MFEELNDFTTWLSTLNPTMYPLAVREKIYQCLDLYKNETQENKIAELEKAIENRRAYYLEMHDFADRAARLLSGFIKIPGHLPPAIDQTMILVKKNDAIIWDLQRWADSWGEDYVKAQYGSK